jgi:amino acid transporter
MAAKVGPSSLALWTLGMVAFFVPLALCVLELSSRLPAEGGLYVWTKTAFGDLHGFIAGWSYWTSNLVFFPSLLLFAAGVFLYLGGDRWLDLANDTSYNTGFCLAALWSATLLNIVGLKRAKWLQNIGGIATWSVTALLLAGAAIAWYRFGAATAIGKASLTPDLGSMSALTTFATIALAYQGLELGPILGGEIKNPRKQIPRAILISVVLITAIYLAGTTALLVALPPAQIDLIGGLPQALAALSERLGMPAFGPLASGLVALGSLGGLGAWITGTARLPFVVGVDRYLPKPLSALHPKYATPYIALLTQASITTLILLAAVSGTTIHEAFLLLIDMTLILSFLPLLYIFTALPLLRHRAAGKNDGINLIPGGSIGCWLVSALGFATTLLAIVTSIVPPDTSANRGLFLIKVGGGCVLIIGIGLAFYACGRYRRDPAAAS